MAINLSAEELNDKIQQNIDYTYSINLSNTSDSSIPKDAEAGELTLDETAAGGLGRHLGVFSTTCLIIGSVIGTGIFATPSSITESVGSVGASILLWVLGWIISSAGLAIWIELGCMIPRSGGEKVYLEAAFRRPKLLATTFFAFQGVVLGFAVAGSIIFASHVVVAADRDPTEWQKRGIALGLIVFVSLLHAFFPGAGVKTMNVVGMLKVFILLFIVVSGWVVLGGKVKKIPDPKASFRKPFEGSTNSGYLYATALFKVLNSWGSASYVLNEVKNPVKTLKIAGPLSLTICGVLYILANISYFASGTPHDVISSGTTVAAFFMGRVFNHAAQRGLSALIAVSAFGNVLTTTFTQARVNQELAKEGVLPFPKFWASSWPFGSPSAGILLQFIPSVIVIVAFPFGTAYMFLQNMKGYPVSLISFIVVVGFFIMRFTSPGKDWKRPFKVWLPVAIFYLLIQVFLLIAPFVKPPGGIGDTPPLPYYLYAIVGIVVMSLGVVWWAVTFWLIPLMGGYTLKPIHEELKDGTRVVVYHRIKQE